MFISSLFASVVAILAAVIPFIGWGVAGLAGLVIVYLLLHNLARPVDSFSEVYEKTQTSDPFDALRNFYGLRSDSSSEAVLERTITDNRNIIASQQLLIGVVLIGMIVGALLCYLSVQTLEEARQVLLRMVELGSANVVGFAIIFYAGKFLLGIPEKLKTRLARGVAFSLMFGVATVATIILLPPLLGESSLSDSVIATEVSINIIAEILFVLYATIAKFYL